MVKLIFTWKKHVHDFVWGTGEVAVESFHLKG